MELRAPAIGCMLSAALLLAPASLGASSPEDGTRPVHTELLAAYPAADTVHRGEIREVRLRYSTAVQPALSTITIIGPAGVLREVGALEAVPGSQEREIRVQLAEPLANGAYRIEWRTAGPDSHPIQGAYSFAVDRPVPEPGTVVTREEPDEVVLTPAAQRGVDAGPGLRSPSHVLVRTLFFLSILGMLGTAGFRVLVLAPLSRDPLLEGVVDEANDRVRALAWGALAFAALALPLRVWKQSAGLFGDAAFQPGNLSRLLLTSGWGGAWFLQLAMTGLFVLGLLQLRRNDERARGWEMMLAAGIGTALVPALSGHAAATADPLRAFAVLNDAVHVTAAGLWMGMLSVLVLAGLGAAGAHRSVVSAPAGGAWSGEEGVTGEGTDAAHEGAGDDGEELGEPAPSAALLPPLARMVNAFSRVALVAVAVLAATGLVNAWIQMGSVGALVTSAYGRTLLVKLAFVGAAASLGFYNWRVVRPALAREPRVGLIRIPASVEAALGLGVVLITALLIATPPPGR